MPPQWGRGGLKGQKASRSKGQSSPSVIRGDLTSGTLTSRTTGVSSSVSPAAAHMNMPGRGQGWGLAIHQRSSPPIPHCCLLVPQPPLGLSFSGSASSLLQCRAPTCPSPPASCLPPQPAWPCALDLVLLTSFLTP